VTKTKNNLLLDQIQKRWKELVPANPELQQIAEFHQEVCACIYRQPPRPEELVLQLTDPKKKLEQGFALLQGEEERLNLTWAARLLGELFQLASTYKETLVEPQRGEGALLFKSFSGPSFLKKVITYTKSVLRSDKTQDSEQLLIQALKGNLDGITQEGVSLELLLTLIPYSLMPTLQAYANQLKSFVELDVWTRGNCPICGAWPALSELRGADQIRYLRCSLCGGDWAYPLLRCPYCENSDHKRLEYFFIEGEEKKYRVYVCEACKGYVKVFPALDPTPAGLLSLEDLATLHFDMIAADKGYSRPYPFQKL
jgi:FdhE protein